MKSNVRLEDIVVPVMLEPPPKRGMIVQFAVTSITCMWSLALTFTRPLPREV